MDNDLSSPGPMVCDKKTFLHIFELEKRRAEREWHSSYLSRLKLELSEGNGEEIKEAADEMMTVLKNRIRSGDTVCRWDTKDFFLILHDIEREDIKGVVKRLKNHYFNRSGLAEEIELDWNYSPFPQRN
ncbi:hypothetical protein [Halarsenatibacter silvermanii]|uniref:GGDEF domain-containing protein n=1 Tax=Halarsenatibacter silvermanii TaxID=321763 RepID=A0A1G9HDF6_9FIRM|nr:hypothetical protein [Halarsenatibacter silvermanii]SDL10754.1 hypothetical protein SAMN04488692_101176 [Halarsenatibacter silvermanii]